MWSNKRILIREHKQLSNSVSGAQSCCVVPPEGTTLYGESVLLWLEMEQTQVLH